MIKLVSQPEHIHTQGVIEQLGPVTSWINTGRQYLPVGQMLVVFFNHPGNKP